MTKPTDKELKEALAAHFSTLGKSGGKARAEGMEPAERKAHAKKMAKQRAKKLTPARRKAIASKAAKARWKKTK